MFIKKSLGKNKDEQDNGIIILKKTEPGMCGGTDATQDTNAPKVINSKDMILFDVTSALSRGYMKSDEETNRLDPLGFVSAFAAPCANGTFMFIEKGRSFHRREEKTRSWAFVKDNVLPELVELVRECDIAKNNGFHSQTHGLPENFGGSVNIRYASGERISFSNNQTPILSFETGMRIVKLFDEAMKGEKIQLPDVSMLKTIRFEENRKNGGFTKATLTINTDKTGINEKKSRYNDPKVYESVKPVEKETIDAIKNNIEATGILAWSDLPDREYGFDYEKSLTFVFSDATEITVPGNKIIPGQIEQGFFSIELEMTTKH